MECSMPGLPIHHQLPEFTQPHADWVSDAIQPSHSLSSPSPPAFNLSEIRVFSNESALYIRWPKYWSFSFRISPSNEYSGLISFRMDWLDLCIHLTCLTCLLRKVRKQQLELNMEQQTFPNRTCMKVRKKQLELDMEQQTFPNRKRSTSRLYVVTLLI